MLAMKCFLSCNVSLLSSSHRQGFTCGTVILGSGADELVAPRRSFGAATAHALKMSGDGSLLGVACV